MRAKPPEVDETELRRVISSGWNFESSSLSYAPVGAGSHHWVAADASGARRFVTVDDLELKPWLGADADTTFAGLKNAYEIAATLRVNGLDFVLAPTPTIRGDALIRLNERFTVALLRFVDGWSRDFDDTLQGQERDGALEMWARLHGATDLVRSRAFERGFGVTARTDLEAALNETDRQWTVGPLSTDARHWVSSNRLWLIRALETFDGAAAAVASRGRRLVITHGEPHGMNLIRSGSGRFLIDWDTVALALPERDLWMLDDGTPGAFRAYVELTGRQVDQDALGFYGMAWHLSDIALFVELLRGPHRDDADSRKALKDLDVAAARLTAYMPR